MAVGFSILEKATEYGNDLREAVVQGGQNAVRKTARAVGEFVHHHPAIAGMTLNQAMQASLVTATALTGLFQATGTYEAVYGPNNPFNQFGVMATHTLSIAGLVYLRSGWAPPIFNQLTVRDMAQPLRGL